MKLSVRVATLAILTAALGTAAAAQGPQTPGFTAEQAKRGAEFYDGTCTMCHGAALDDGQFGPPLKGQPHAAYWKGKDAADVLTYMNNSMPPTDPGGLGAQAYADIYAYLLQSGGATPGDKPLPTDPAALKGAAPTR
jgi:mono/diheme cytochrome c family protein